MAEPVAAGGRVRAADRGAGEAGLEELGPTFIKLGQILSTRVDVFPPDWIDEFEKLQNRVPPLPPAMVRKMIVDTLGAEADQLFAEFDMQPIGSASIAQVHRARLKDGREVAVKLRRPGIADKVEADLRILAHLAHLLELEFPELRRYQPSGIAAQFARSLRRELDLAIERAIWSVSPRTSSTTPSSWCRKCIGSTPTPPSMCRPSSTACRPAICRG